MVYVMNVAACCCQQERV